MAVAAWISALSGVVAAYLAWRTMRIQESRGVDPALPPAPEGDGSHGTEVEGASGARHVIPGGTSYHIGLPPDPPPGSWTVLPARRGITRVTMILAWAMGGAAVVAFLSAILAPGIDPALRLAEGLGSAAGIGFFGGGGVQGYRLLTNPWTLAIGSDGLLLQAAGRSWMVRWDEVDRVAVRSVNGSQAVVLWMAVPTTFPGLWRPFQPGPKWWSRRQAVVFTFTSLHHGGQQAITGALRYYAGRRWSGK